MRGDRKEYLPEDFWRRVEARGVNECWPWRGTVAEDGYGFLSWRLPTYGARSFASHRVAFFLATGIVQPRGMVIRHTCDNPACCNPNHLLLGTYQDNADDCVRRGRRGANRRVWDVAKPYPLPWRDIPEVVTRWVRWIPPGGTVFFQKAESPSIKPVVDAVQQETGGTYVVQQLRSFPGTRVWRFTEENRNAQA